MKELASGKLLLDEPGESVARLTIANPERRGALDHELLDALAESARSLDVRCLIIRGTGEVFSAGYDLGNLEGQKFEEAAERLVAHPFHEAIEALDAYPYPIVAQLGGHAIGGGLELALTCDLRVAAAGIKLSMPPAKLGLIYSHTGLRRFVEVCGVARTPSCSSPGTRWTPSARSAGARERGGGAGAARGARARARTEIAGNAPLSLAGNKRVMRALRDPRLPEELERELIELRESCFRSEDFREGVRAFAEKRKPVWRGR